MNLSSKTQFETIPYVPLLSAPICFMIVWAIILLTVSAFGKIARDKARDKDRPLRTHFKQVPCINCRFFNNNHYLKCAAHPSAVLTKQALNCSDYCPQQ